MMGRALAKDAEEFTLIDFIVMPSVALEDWVTLPKISCLYFAIDASGTILYIGKTNQLRNRWGNHDRLAELRNFEGVRIHYQAMPVSQAESLEKTLILFFEPMLNRMTIPFHVRRSTPKVIDEMMQALSFTAHGHFFDAIAELSSTRQQELHGILKDFLGR